MKTTFAFLVLLFLFVVFLQSGEAKTVRFFYREPELELEFDCKCRVEDLWRNCPDNEDIFKCISGWNCHAPFDCIATDRNNIQHISIETLKNKG